MTTWVSSCQPSSMPRGQACTSLHGILPTKQCWARHHQVRMEWQQSQFQWMSGCRNCMQHRRPGSTFWPTLKVSSRTEWRQCPIGKLVAKSCYRLTTKARASQRSSQRSGQVPHHCCPQVVVLKEPNSRNWLKVNVEWIKHSTLQLYPTPVQTTDTTKLRRFLRNVCDRQAVFYRPWEKGFLCISLGPDKYEFSRILLHE